VRAGAFSIILGGILCALPASAQFKLSGYLSALYENGQSESDYPEGTFHQVKAGLLFSGQTAKIFDYGLEIQFKSESHVEIEEAWVGVVPTESFHLKLGFYLVPFGTYNTANRPHQTFFIQPPLPQARLYPESWRDIGLLAEGKWGFLRYSVYLGNGVREGTDLEAGQQFKDNNGNLAGGGRLSFLLSETFDVGLSYYRGRYDDAGQRSLELKGADLNWETTAFHVLYEYGKALIDNPSDYSRGTSDGHFFLFSVNLAGVSPLVSYQTLKYEDPYHGQGFDPLGLPGTGIATDISRWTVGLVYAASDGLLFKIEYDFNKEKLVEQANNVFLVQAALQF
jgi:hypothetical protein